MPYVPSKHARKMENSDSSDTNIENKKNDINDVLQPHLTWGPWRVPGIWGTINNAFACIYIIFVLFWSFWPPETPVTPKNMNYSVLMTGVVIGFSIIYYYVWGKDQYRGPLIEYEVRDIARGNTIGGWPWNLIQFLFVGISFECRLSEALEFWVLLIYME